MRLSGFVHATGAVFDQPGEYVMVAWRTDTQMHRRINFERGDWEARLRRQVRNKGKPQGSYELDVVVHSKRLFDLVSTHPFVVGVFCWDNQLLSEALRHADVDVVDASDAVLVVHMGTDRQGDRDSKHHARSGSNYANELAHNISNQFFMIVAFRQPLVPSHPARGCLRYSTLNACHALGCLRRSRWHMIYCATPSLTDTPVYCPKAS